MKIDLSEFRNGFYIDVGIGSYDLKETKKVTDPKAKNYGDEYTINHGYFGSLSILFKHFVQIITSRKKSVASLSEYIEEWRNLIKQLEENIECK